MDFRILGPLEVREGEREVPLGRGKQRALLALLLLHRDQAISTDRIVDELWGERSPPTAAKIVQNHVLQLRRALENGDSAGADLVTRGRGYLLRVEPGKLDLDTFQQLVEAAERALGAGEAAEAAEALRAALALWRGPALADFTDEPFAQTAIERLEELRLAALERRIEADLALGRHADVVGELKELVSAHPLREGFRAQLMLALYRSGRQAEALDVYRDARRALVEELGIEPSPALQELEQAILRQELPPAPERPPPAAAGRFPARRWAWTLVAVGGAVVLAAVAFAVVRLTGGDEGAPQVEGSGVASIDSEGGAVASFTQAGRTPSNVAVGEGAVWVLDADDRTISEIDPESGRIVKTFSTGSTPRDIAVGAGALWIGNQHLDTFGSYTESISKIDPASTRVTRTLVLPHPAENSRAPVVPFPGVSQLAVGADSLWAINPAGTVSRFDAETGEPETTIPVEATSFGGIAYGEGGVWVVTEGPGVRRIDPTTNRPGKMVRLPATGLAGLATGAGSVWASAPEEGVVWRIEPGAEPVARTIEVSVGRGVVAIAFGEGALWAANYADGTIARIDPATNVVTRTRMPGNLQGIAAGIGSAWVSVLGGTTAAPLSTAACEPLESGGQRPDVLIASDAPLQGEQAPYASLIVDAIRFVLRRHGFRAGSYAVGYHSCDDATAQTESWSDVKCMANARAYGAAEQVVAVIGPYNSGCAQWELPITNRGPSGPVPVISHSNTYAGLTREAPSNLRADEPGSLYPTGVRHYFRVVADDEVEGMAAALLARQLGLKHPYLLDILPPEHIYARMLEVGFETAARKLGLSLAGARSWEPGATSYAALADRVARARPDGVFLVGYPWFGGVEVNKALRDRLGADVIVLANDTFGDPLLLPSVRGDPLGEALEGMYVLQTWVQVNALGRTGKRLVHEFAASPPRIGLANVPETIQTVELLLQAIARSDGTRRSVLEQLRQTRVENGVLGSFSFDARGDRSPRVITVERVERGRYVFDRRISVPATLVP